MISFGFGEMIHLHIEGTKYIPGIIVPSIVVLLSARGGTRQATINEQASTQVYTYTGGRGTRQAITKTNIYTPAGVSGLQTSEHQNSIHRGGGGATVSHYFLPYFLHYFLRRQRPTPAADVTIHFHLPSCTISASTSASRSACERIPSFPRQC